MDARDVVCPTCNGQKANGPVHVNRGDKPHYWLESVRCYTCDGVGRITSEHLVRIAWGRALMTARRSRDLSLRELASKLGVGTADLSAVEHGRRPATPEILAALRRIELLPQVQG